MKRLFILYFLFCFGALAIAQRPEYPRPQFVRSQWINLNGAWSYQIDMGGSGIERGFQKSKGFDGKITVPFCPESKLSGVGYKDFIENLWYQRYIDIPADWNGKRILLNFGAVYYQSEIYIDGNFVTRHFGGTSSFSVDLTDYVKAGSRHSLVVYVKSDLRHEMQPCGKQSTQFFSHDCDYTRCTGIWQTVWMEAVAMNGLKSVQTITDIDQGQLVVNPTFYETNHSRLRVTVMDGKKTVSTKIAEAAGSSPIVVPIKNAKLWSPEHPFLYDVKYEVIDNNAKVVDEVKSYVGMRKIQTIGNRIYLNNKPIYLRLVLDQGFYPDGIWTAPNDEALKHDIELSMSCGFNGARLHQKVFEERFHYYADKMGYLTFGESSSWGLDYNRMEAARVFTPEWIEIVERDRNHPSIIAWVPNNEQNNFDRVNFPRYMEELYKVTKLIDPTRPYLGNSGGTHFAADIYSTHEYTQDPKELKKIIWNDGKLKEAYRAVILNRVMYNTGSNFPSDCDNFNWLEHKGRIPYLLDEYGGVSYSANGGWGYGGVSTEKDFYKHVGELTDAILECAPSICGYCYTQLTDVEQEQNGLFHFDRTPKFKPEELRKIFGKNPSGFDATEK